MTEGYEKGDICNRDGCDGILDEHHSDGCCSCHVNPPCSHCVEDRSYCTKCHYDAFEE
jgi:hypothetical protein